MERISERLLNWASVLEDSTRAQAEATAGMPFIYPHLALMPDAHLGKGSTVGSVIPTLGAVMPAAVGVDIGCGMIAVRTQFTEGEFRGRRPLRSLRQAIERAVPLSAGRYNRHLTETARRRVEHLSQRAEQDGVHPGEHVSGWHLQLGTLGSGNHFIEVSVDEQSRVWLFLHSGSRGVGNRIAQRHIRTAQIRCERQRIPLPHRDLAYLTDGTDEFWHYLRELRWAQEYALLNREEMMDRVVGCVAGWTGTAVVEHERINCHHNFTQQEHHFGEQVWVSRKGAIEATEGRPGLIPGSMGTASYVVTGRGNPAALNSAPHGAGRRYSRSAARRTFTREQLRTAMAGVEYRDSEAFLDEIPQAYKDIDVVLADAADLVDIRHTLRQIVNVKGD